MHNHVAFKISFRCRKWELYYTDFSALYTSWATCEMGGFLVNKNKPIDKFRVIYGAADLGCYVNVIQITVSRGLLVDDFQDRVYCNRCQQVRVVRYNFRAERSNSILNKLVPVV